MHCSIESIEQREEIYPTSFFLNINLSFVCTACQFFHKFYKKTWSSDQSLRPCSEMFFVFDITKWRLGAFLLFHSKPPRLCLETGSSGSLSKLTNSYWPYILLLLFFIAFLIFLEDEYPSLIKAPNIFLSAIFFYSIKIWWKNQVPPPPSALLVPHTWG